MYGKPCSLMCLYKIYIHFFKKETWCPKKKFSLVFLSGHPVYHIIGKIKTKIIKEIIKKLYLPAADPDTDERGRGGGK